MIVRPLIGTFGEASEHAQAEIGVLPNQSCNQIAELVFNSFIILRNQVTVSTDTDDDGERLDHTCGFTNQLEST